MATSLQEIKLGDVKHTQTIMEILIHLEKIPHLPASDRLFMAPRFSQTIEADVGFSGIRPAMDKSIPRIHLRPGNEEFSVVKWILGIIFTEIFLLNPIMSIIIVGNIVFESQPHHPRRAICQFLASSVERER